MTKRLTNYRATAGVAMKAACVVCATVVGTTPTLAQDWTNTTGNRNFADFGNWSGGLNSFTGTNRDWTITLTGTNRAELATALATNLQRDLTVGTATAQGELVFTTGSIQ